MAARSLFGENPKQFDKKEIGKQEFVFSGLSNNVVSFLPLSWYEELKDKNGRVVKNGGRDFPLSFGLIYGVVKRG